MNSPINVISKTSEVYEDPRYVSLTKTKEIKMKLEEEEFSELNPTSIANHKSKPNFPLFSH